MDRGGVIYVARVRKDGSLALAKPCVRCLNAIKHRGISKVYYTVSDTEVGVINV